MRCRFLIAGALALLLVSPATTSTQDDLWHAAVAFDKHWDTYVRKLFGCDPTGPTSQETCDLNRSVIDYVAFTKARNQAKKLFQLRDR